MNEQETVNRLAVLAGPRAAALLRLRSVKHVYDPTPGVVNCTGVEDGRNVILDRVKSSSQPYKHIERFLGDDKIEQYIVGPGLLPVVTALSKAIMGKTLLVTRRVATRDSDKGVVAHVDGFGKHIMMYMDEEAGDTIVKWSACSACCSIPSIVQSSPRTIMKPVEF